MISTNAKAQTTYRSINQQPIVPVKQCLEARWSKVNGKLICQWVKA